MGTLGNEADARFIRDWFTHADAGQRWDGAPEGWAFIGRGVFRSAYLSPSGVIYKVNRTPESVLPSEEISYDDNGGNAAEAQNLARIMKECKPPQGARLPEWSYFALEGDGVMAMEFVRGEKLATLRGIDPDLFWRKRAELECAFDLGDMNGGNVIIEEGTGTLVPVDFGI